MSDYTFRKSAIEKPQHWQLSEQEFLCSMEGRGTLRMPYSKIQRIRLFYHPNNRYRLNNYCCKITTKDTITYDIYSCTYNGFADFIDQAETYTPFVEELVQKTKAANPECELLTGNTPSSFYGNIILVIVAVAFMFFLLAGMPDEYRNSLVFTKIFVIVFLGIYLVKYIKANKPRPITEVENTDFILPKLSRPPINDIPLEERNETIPPSETKN